MAKLSGISMTKSEILERFGDITQICDVRNMVYGERRASGAAEIETLTHEIEEVRN